MSPKISKTEAEEKISEVVKIYSKAMRKIGYPVKEKGKEEEFAERIARIAWGTIRKTYDVTGLSNKEKVLIIFDSINLRLSREETHSLVYLLDREKGLFFPGYKYVPYGGPYSTVLQNDVNLLTSIGNLEVFHSQICYEISKQGSEILSEKRKEHKAFAVAYDEINIATQELLKDFGKNELLKRAYYVLSKEMAERMRTG